MLSILVVLPLTATSSVLAATPAETDLNAEADARVAQILALYDERDRIFYQDVVDIVALNEIDLQLHNLGVEFLTESEVAVQFPEIKSSVESASANIGQQSSGDAAVMPTADVPTSSVNYWTSYRISGYWYGSKQYDIQRLTVQPIDEDASVLWREESWSEYPCINWASGGTALLSALASYGLSYGAELIGSKIYTVYEVLSTIASVGDSFGPTSVINLEDTIYRYELSTTVTFSLVRLVGETDDDQKLAHVASKCTADFVFVMDTDSYITQADGTQIPIPSQLTGQINETFESPYLGATGRECHAYEYAATLPVNDCITSIELTGPDDVYVYTIYPPAPSYFYQVDQ